ncbi:MAG: dienelactone hydrolase family protein [Anaerolineales bacterium]|nr:dienelactone hydrolase family protein [Anaerolineales bacterium]
MKPSPPLRVRILRLSAFALLVGLIAYLALNCGMAWLYMYFFTHPFCNRNPVPMQGLPAPQEYELLTEDGLALRAWYYPPENGAAVLSLGALSGSLGDNLPPVGFLARQGYGVLQIDSRVCARPSAPVTLGAREIYAAKAGLDFLLARPEVERIGAIGFSMGGATAIRAAARYPQIEAVVAEGGYFNLGEDIVEPGLPKPPSQKLLFYTIAGFYWLTTGENPWQISPVDEIPKISPRPALLIYGEYEVDDGRAWLQYEAAGEPKELWIVPGGNHGANYAVATQEYERKVLAFFEHALLGP